MVINSPEENDIFCINVDKAEMMMDILICLPLDHTNSGNFIKYICACNHRNHLPKRCDFDKCYLCDIQKTTGRFFIWNSYIPISTYSDLNFIYNYSFSFRESFGIRQFLHLEQCVHNAMNI